MTTLADPLVPVDSDLDLDLDLDESDLAWWAADTGEDAANPDPETDLAWILEEVTYHETRATEAGFAALLDGVDSDPTESHLLAASIIRAIACSMRFARATSIETYFRVLPAVFPRPVPVHLPRPGTRRSPLAAALDVLTAWYLHLDRSAADMIAWNLHYAADGAEEWGSASRDDYYDDEAAYFMAIAEAVAHE